MCKTQETPKNICPSAMRVISGRYVCARTLAEPMCKLTVIGPVCPCPDQNELKKCAKPEGINGAGTEKKDLPEDCRRTGCDTFGNTYFGRCASFKTAAGLAEQIRD